MKLWYGGGSFWKNFVREFFQKTKVAAQRGAKTGHGVHIVGKISPLVPKVAAHCGQNQPTMAKKLLSSFGLKFGMEIKKNARNLLQKE